MFYIKLCGEKTEEKQFILNKCLVKVALKWRNNKKGKDFGKYYQPSTWDMKLKYLFAIFHRKMIQFNQLTDFNGDGEFHSVLTAQWVLEMEKDETFASGVGTSTFDDDADKKLRELFAAGKFNSFSTATTTKACEDRKKYMVYVLGRFFYDEVKRRYRFRIGIKLNLLLQHAMVRAMNMLRCQPSGTRHTSVN